MKANSQKQRCLALRYERKFILGNTAHVNVVLQLPVCVLPVHIDANLDVITSNLMFSTII